MADFHWTELRPETCAPILGSMLQPGGIHCFINCRLKGEPTKGALAVPAEERMVVFDEAYVINRFNSLMSKLTDSEKAQVIKLLAKNNQVNLLDSDEQNKEEVKGNEKTKKAVREKG